MAFLNTPGQLKQISTVTPGQANIIGQSGTGALDLLKQIQGQQFNFDPIAQQARSQFQTETIPSIAERFSSMGSGAQKSSAFQSALGRAGSGLEQSLAALRSQYGLQKRGLNQQLLNSLLGVGLTPQFQSYYQPGEQGWGTSILSALAQGLGMAVPALASGGATLPMQLGQLVAQRAAASQPSYLGGGYPSGGGFANPNIIGGTGLSALMGGF